MKKIQYVLFFSIAGMLPSVLFAQEPATSKATSKSVDHWGSAMDVGAAIYSGNVNKQDVRALFSLVRKDELLDFSMDLKSILSKVDDETKNKEYSLSLKVDYLPKKKLTPFILFNAYQNMPKGYESRFGGYVGAKGVLFKNECANYSLSAAYLFEKEKFIEGDAINNSEKNSSKLSIRPKIEQSIGEYAALEMIGFYIPSFQKFEDYRIDLDASISSKLTAKIFMKFAYTLNYVNIPPKVEIQKTDQAFVASIVFKF